MNLVVQTADGVDCPDTLYWPQIHGQPIGALRDELACFVDAVRRGEPPSIVTPEEALTAVAVLTAAEKSARTGKPIRL